MAETTYYPLARTDRLVYNRPPSYFRIPEQVTVAELTRKLGQLPPDLPVYVEGDILYSAERGVRVVEHNGRDVALIG